MESTKTTLSFLFLGLLLYTVVYYSQIGARITVLAPLRIEFLLGSVLLTAIAYNFIKQNISLSETRITYAAILFLIICGITVPLAYVKSTALAHFMQLIKFMAIYFMIISGIYTEKHLFLFMIVYLCMISLLFVEPFILSLQGLGFRFNNHMMRLYGVTGFFEHPNQLGGIVSENIPFFYFMMLYTRSKFGKIALFLLMLIGLKVIMLTQSRTAFVGILAFTGLIWLKSKNRILILLLLLIAAIVAWNLAPEQTRERFMTMGRSVDVLTSADDEYKGDIELGSMNSRWTLIKRSLTVFFENPILGVGIGCYPSVSGQKWNSWFPTHNLYTQALSELGILGTSIFFYVVYLIFVNIAKCRHILAINNDRTLSYYLNTALWYVLVIRLVIGLFGHDLYRNWWWVAAGLSVVNMRILRTRYSDA